MGKYYCVALHAESVDRNFCLFFGRAKIPRSLSMRRAWIEIGSGEIMDLQLYLVALHAESVDRNNTSAMDPGLAQRRSPCGERG